MALVMTARCHNAQRGSGIQEQIGMGHAAIHCPDGEGAKDQRFRQAEQTAQQGCWQHKHQQLQRMGCEEVDGMHVVEAVMTAVASYSPEKG